MNEITRFYVQYNVNISKRNQAEKSVEFKTLEEVLELYHERAYNSSKFDGIFECVKVCKTRNSTTTETLNISVIYENWLNEESPNPTRENEEPTSWHCEVDSVITEAGNIAVTWPIPALQNAMRWLRLPTTMDIAYSRAIDCYDLFSRLGITANVRLISNLQK